MSVAPEANECASRHCLDLWKGTFPLHHLLVISKNGVGNLHHLFIHKYTSIEFTMTTTIRNYFRYLSIAVVLAAFAPLHAADKSAEVITVAIPKFGNELVKKWIQEYTETHPDIRLQVVDGKTGDADLEFVSDAAPQEKKPYVTYVGRYAILPVTTANNPLHEKLSRKHLDKKELKELFFQENALQKADKERKDADPFKELTVYSGTSQTSGAKAFASFFGLQTSQLRGKRIAGDDLYLLTAINKDHSGVTFNNLTYLFDLQNRKLKPNLSLIPLDLKKEQRAVLEKGNLDETLQLLEKGEVALIPLPKIGFTYSDKASVADFLHWIVEKGQQYNHNYGFLTLDEKSAHKEQKQLEDQLLSNR